MFKIPREKDPELTVFWVNHEIVPNGLDKRNYEGEIFPLKSLDFYVVTDLFLLFQSFDKVV